MNDYQQPQIGLVLAGGGAKGAYQAGALRYLAEIGLRPQIIAGTSIGALNGAILAANTPFKNAVKQLNDIWTELGETKVIIADGHLGITAFNHIAKAFIPTFRHWLVDFAFRITSLRSDRTMLDPQMILDDTPL